MLRAITAGALAGLLLATATAAAAPAPGSYDASFSGDGRATTDFGASEGGGSVAVAPDGRIVVAGLRATPAGNASLAVARYTAGGGLDTSFSGDGRFTMGFEEAVESAHVAVQADGKVVAAGLICCQGVSFVLRLRTNGTLDPAFGDGIGYVRGGGTRDSVSDLEIQPDGKILLTGVDQQTAGRFGEFLTRLLPDGRPDPAFDPGPGHFEMGYLGGPLAQQPDGRILLTGSYLQRRLKTGAYDTSFGGSGTGETFGTGTADLLVQPDGRILSGGAAWTDPGFTRLDATIDRRLSPSGAFDASFGGGDGVVELDFDPRDSTTALALQPNGKIVAAIVSITDTGVRRWRVVRLLADGRRDESFGPGGARLLTVPGFAAARPSEIALTGDGRIVTAGTAVSGSRSDFAVTRVWGDPVPLCAGKRPTIASGEALVVGSDRPDVITGSLGRDRIVGLAGNDVICGSDGRDVLEGGVGNDRLYGQAGDDALFGLAGDDRLDGGAGTDTGDGGTGTDTATAVETVSNVP